MMQSNKDHPRGIREAIFGDNSLPFWVGYETHRRFDYWRCRLMLRHYDGKVGRRQYFHLSPTHFLQLVMKTRELNTPFKPRVPLGKGDKGRGKLYQSLSLLALIGFCDLGESFGCVPYYRHLYILALGLTGSGTD